MAQTKRDHVVIPNTDGCVYRNEFTGGVYVDLRKYGIQMVGDCIESAKMAFRNELIIEKNAIPEPIRLFIQNFSY